MPRWWMNMVTGPDNLTVSLGRVLGLVLFINLLLAFPAFLVGVAVAQKVAFNDLIAALPSIGTYVVAVGGTCAAIIGLTNHTEPRP